MVEKDKGMVPYKIVSGENGDAWVEVDGKKYTIIDTAGMRKRGKIFESVEKYSVLRAFSAIERCNICLLVIDASTCVKLLNNL